VRPFEYVYLAIEFLEMSADGPACFLATNPLTGTVRYQLAHGNLDRLGPHKDAKK
jgi:hypothetical protein